MRKVIALAGQVRAKGGRGAPYARLVCLVFVSRASNSMLSNLAGASAYGIVHRAHPSQQLRVRGQRETASHTSAGHMLLRATRSRLEPTGPAGRAAQRGRTALCPFRKDTSLFKRTHGNLRLPSHTMNTCRNANYPERTLSSLPDRSVSVPRSVCSQTLQQHMCMVHAHVHVHVHAHCAG